MMKDADKAFIQGYNAQAAVDVDSQVIVVTTADSTGAGTASTVA